MRSLAALLVGLALGYFWPDIRAWLKLWAK